MPVVEVKMISEGASDITLLKTLIEENIGPQCFEIDLNIAANCVSGFIN